jgi:hypothetical protein
MVNTEFMKVYQETLLVNETKKIVRFFIIPTTETEGLAVTKLNFEVEKFISEKCKAHNKFIDPLNPFHLIIIEGLE